MSATDVMRGAARTDPGRVRSNNEDLPVIDPVRGIFGVIDGVGGEAGGEIAAATAYDVIMQRLARPSGTPAERVREAIAIANNEIYRRAQGSPELYGMACVVTLAIVADGVLTIGHVGDTRLYLVGAESVQKLTSDHSPVGEREDAGELGEVDAMRHPRRNEVFRDIGSMLRDKDETGFVDVIEQPVPADTAIVICSDGLSDMLTSSTIGHIVRQHAGDPSGVVGALVDAANDAGGKDNITVVYAEGSRFPASLGSLTPTEPLPNRPTPAVTPTDAPLHGRVHRFTRAVFGSRVVWLAIGLLSGVLGALGLAMYVARTQVQPPQTLVVSREAGAPFAGIADAMAASRPGDAVRVEPGDYVERVVVADGVDLIARAAGTVTIRRPPGLDAAMAGVVAGGSLGSRIAGVRITTADSSAPSPPAIGMSVSGSGVTLELVDISGGFARALDLAPGASLTMHGGRVGVSGAIVSVPDGAQASFVNNVFVRTTPSADPAIVAGALSRLTLTSNVFTGFEPEIVRGLSEARRRELLAGNLVVLPQAPPRSGGRRR